MSIRSTQNSPIRIGALLTGTFLLSVFAVDAFAQQQPKPFPWEKNADKFFSRSVPEIENPIDKRINEGLRRLGLPPQPKLDITGEEIPQTEPPGLSQTVLPRLDTNRDGYVSRQEYVSSRQRVGTVGRRGTQHHVHRNQRIDARFRAADRNRDGRLSPDEIDQIKGPRF